jgi:hypothetical protein
MLTGTFTAGGLLLLAACAAPAPSAAPGQPDLAGPLAVRELGRMKEMDARGDWAALAATDLSGCGGPRDAVCAERQALRARGCARMAASPGLSETARRPFLDCAVTSGRAALDAAEATAPAERATWREAYATALFERRQARPGTEACTDNTPLLAEADRLRAEAPAAPRPRFLAASARLTAVARECGPAAARCADLAAARGLLRDPPADAVAQWQSLGAGVDATARRLACPA